MDTKPVTKPDEPWLLTTLQFCVLKVLIDTDMSLTLRAILDYVEKYHMDRVSYQLYVLENHGYVISNRGRGGGKRWAATKLAKKHWPLLLAKEERLLSELQEFIQQSWSMGDQMKAKELRPGDTFCVDPPDAESPIRVCLTNDETNGLRFGWPGSKVWFVGGSPQHTGFWCYMGEECEVKLVEKKI